MRHIILLHGAAPGENAGNHWQRVELIRQVWHGADDVVATLCDVSLGALDLRLVAEADLVVIVQLANPVVEDLVGWRRAHGLPTVFEINDDIAAAPGWLDAGHSVRNPILRQELLSLAAVCDGVQFTSAGLADRYAILHPRRFVVEPPVSLLPRGKPSGAFVIGWGGTTSHRDDLAWIAPTLATFLADNPDARFAFMGNLREFADVLALLPASQVDQAPWGDAAAYERFLAGLHVGLAPLKPSRFNAGRSDGKFAQYAAAGVVPVLSAGPVYDRHADHALCFEDPEALRSLLQRLHDEPAWREDVAKCSRDWVAVHRSKVAVGGHLRQCYFPLLADVPIAGPASVAAPPWQSALSALRAQQADDELLVAAKALLTDWPDCHEARVVAAEVLLRRQCFEEVLQLIESAPPRQALDGDRLPSLAFRAAERCRPEARDFWLDQVRLPQRRLRLRGPEGDVQGYFKALLALAPFDYFALLGRIRWLQRHGDAENELPELLGRAELLAPDKLA